MQDYYNCYTNNSTTKAGIIGTIMDDYN